MSAANASLEAAGGSLELSEVRRRVVVREDGTYRLDADSEVRRMAQLELTVEQLRVRMCLDAQDCRQLAAQLVAMARQLEEGA